MNENIWPTVHAERRALADQLGNLTAQQWATPSLCADWTVHDVLAHLLSLAKMTPPKFAVKFAAAGFGFDRFTAQEVVREGRGGPEATLIAFREASSRTSAPPGPKQNVLGEMFVHGEDIRRPLGLTREYPVDQVATVLRFYARRNPIVGGRARVAEVRLRATDTDCTIGTGPTVEGRALSLLLATSGRKSALTELSGDGVAVLAQRV